jgi:hypothetical protein
MAAEIDPNSSPSRYNPCYLPGAIELSDLDEFLAR